MGRTQGLDPWVRPMGPTLGYGSDPWVEPMGRPMGRSMPMGSTRGGEILRLQPQNLTDFCGRMAAFWGGVGGGEAQPPKCRGVWGGAQPPPKVIGPYIYYR